jgi:hypothetical protein
MKRSNSELYESKARWNQVEDMSKTKRIARGEASIRDHPEMTKIDSLRIYGKPDNTKKLLVNLEKNVYNYLESDGEGIENNKTRRDFIWTKTVKRAKSERTIERVKRPYLLFGKTDDKIWKNQNYNRCSCCQNKDNLMKEKGKVESKEQVFMHKHPFVVGKTRDKIWEDYEYTRCTFCFGKVVVNNPDEKTEVGNKSERAKSALPSKNNNKHQGTKLEITNPVVQNKHQGVRLNKTRRMIISHQIFNYYGKNGDTKKTKTEVSSKPKTKISEHEVVRLNKKNQGPKRQQKFQYNWVDKDTKTCVPRKMTTLKFEGSFEDRDIPEERIRVESFTYFKPDEDKLIKQSKGINYQANNPNKSKSMLKKKTEEDQTTRTGEMEDGEFTKTTKSRNDDKKHSELKPTVKPSIGIIKNKSVSKAEPKKSTNLQVNRTPTPSLNKQRETDHKISENKLSKTTQPNNDITRDINEKDSINKQTGVLGKNEAAINSQANERNPSHDSDFKGKELDIQNKKTLDIPITNQQRNPTIVENTSHSLKKTDIKGLDILNRQSIKNQSRVQQADFEENGEIHEQNQVPATKSESESQYHLGQDSMHSEEYPYIKQNTASMAISDKDNEAKNPLQTIVQEPELKGSELTKDIIMNQTRRNTKINSLVEDDQPEEGQKSYKASLKNIAKASASIDSEHEKKQNEIEINNQEKTGIPENKETKNSQNEKATSELKDQRDSKAQPKKTHYDLNDFESQADINDLLISKNSQNYKISNQQNPAKPSIVDANPSSKVTIQVNEPGISSNRNSSVNDNQRKSNFNKVNNALLKASASNQNDRVTTTKRLTQKNSIVSKDSLVLLSKTEHEAKLNQQPENDSRQPQKTLNKETEKQADTLVLLDSGQVNALNINKRTTLVNSVDMPSPDKIGDTIPPNQPLNNRMSANEKPQLITSQPANDNNQKRKTIMNSISSVQSILQDNNLNQTAKDSVSNNKLYVDYLPPSDPSMNNSKADLTPQKQTLVAQKINLQNLKESVSPNQNTFKRNTLVNSISSLKQNANEDSKTNNEQSAPTENVRPKMEQSFKKESGQGNPTEPQQLLKKDTYLQTSNINGNFNYVYQKNQTLLNSIRNESDGIKSASFNSELHPRVDLNILEGKTSLIGPQENEPKKMEDSMRVSQTNKQFDITQKELDVKNAKLESSNVNGNFDFVYQKNQTLLNSINEESDGIKSASFDSQIHGQAKNSQLNSQNSMIGRTGVDEKISRSESNVLIDKNSLIRTAQEDEKMRESKDYQLADKNSVVELIKPDEKLGESDSLMLVDKNSQIRKTQPDIHQSHSESNVIIDKNSLIKMDPSENKLNKSESEIFVDKNSLLKLAKQDEHLNNNLAHGQLKAANATQEQALMDKQLIYQKPKLESSHCHVDQQHNERQQETIQNSLEQSDSHKNQSNVMIKSVESGNERPILSRLISEKLPPKPVDIQPDVTRIKTSQAINDLKNNNTTLNTILNSLNQSQSPPSFSFSKNSFKQNEHLIDTYEVQLANLKNSHKSFDEGYNDTYKETHLNSLESLPKLETSTANSYTHPDIHVLQSSNPGFDKNMNLITRETKYNTIGKSQFPNQLQLDTSPIRLQTESVAQVSQLQNVQFPTQKNSIIRSSFQESLINRSSPGNQTDQNPIAGPKFNNSNFEKDKQVNDTNVFTHKNSIEPMTQRKTVVKPGDVLVFDLDALEKANHFEVLYNSQDDFDNTQYKKSNNTKKNSLQNIMTGEHSESRMATEEEQMQAPKFSFAQKIHNLKIDTNGEVSDSMINAKKEAMTQNPFKSQINVFDSNVEETDVNQGVVNFSFVSNQEGGVPKPKRRSSIKRSTSKKSLTKNPKRSKSKGKSNQATPQKKTSATFVKI